MATWSVAELMPRTSVRSSSIVKLIESAIAPVTSSVTDACTVRSPSARLPISLSSRRMASWLRLFSCSLSNARTRASSRNTLPSAISESSAKIAKIIAAQNVNVARRVLASYSLGELGHVGQQRLGLLVDAAAGLLGDDQALHVLQDRVDAALRSRRSAFAARRSVVRASSAWTAGNAQRIAALEQPVENVAERAGVLAEQERDLGIDLVRRHQRVGVLGDALREDGQLIREIDFAQRAAALRDLRRRPAARVRAARCCPG